MILGYEIETSKKEFVTKNLLLAVGVLEGAGRHPSTAKNPPKNPPLIALVALWNEFGTEDKGGKPILLPRPFMRDTLRENKEKYRNLMAKSIRAINAGKTTTSGAIDVIGATVASDIKTRMDVYGVVDSGITKRFIDYIEVGLP